MVLYRKRFHCVDERIMRMRKDLSTIRSTQYPESQLTVICTKFIYFQI